MTVPGSNPVQFVPNSGDFTVDSISDPGGAPSNILDVDLGLVVSGKVTLPHFLSGKGQVCIYADELGGPIDQRLAPCPDSTGRTPPTAMPSREHSSPRNR